MKPAKKRVRSKPNIAPGLKPAVHQPEGMTLSEVAEVMGVTRERVRQIEAKAIRKLRWLLTAKGIVKTKDIL